jgi:LCP family protein required for cell wall assembly
MPGFAQNSPVQPTFIPGFHPQNTPVLPPLSRQATGKKTGKKRRFPMWARIVIAVMAVLLVALGSGLWYYQSNFAAPITNITNQQAAHIGEDGKSTNQLTTTGNGIGTKRVNILLLGSDNDGKNQAPLAQTDIVVTIDPQTHYVGMLSIPRDLRVVIPDNGAGKLDAAFSFGWSNEHVGPTPFSNAVGLSIATIQKNFGIPINYYAWVGLDGFVKVINTAGGVDIDAIHPITDNAYPDDVNTKDHFGYERLYIPPGPQHMNGMQALQYVRTRHADLVGDFGRSARQQQILDQLKVKLDTPSIVTKLPELANDLGDTVKTDMSIQDIVNFMEFARTLNTNKIDRLILSPPYSAMANDKTGDFLPNCAMIMPKIAKMFALGNNANCITAAGTNTGSALASLRSATSAPITMSALNAPVQNASLSQLNALSQSTGDTFGVHSLLDMMFLVVFNSFEATKV